MSLSEDIFRKDIQCPNGVWIYSMWREIILHNCEHLLCLDFVDIQKKFPEGFVWDLGWSQHPHLRLLKWFLAVLKWKLGQVPESKKISKIFWLYAHWEIVD